LICLAVTLTGEKYNRTKGRGIAIVVKKTMGRRSNEQPTAEATSVAAEAQATQIDP
jgi:hypothetical protein